VAVELGPCASDYVAVELPRETSSTEVGEESKYEHQHRGHGGTEGVPDRTRRRNDRCFICCAVKPPPSSTAAGGVEVVMVEVAEVAAEAEASEGSMRSTMW
jgi:hypothetical protein